MLDVYWNDVDVPGWNLLGWLSDMECILEGETEFLIIQGVIINCLACYLSLSFSWCGATIACILCLCFRYPSVKWLISKKWLTRSSTIWRPFFRALIFGSCLSTIASESLYFLVHWDLSTLQVGLQSTLAWESKFPGYGPPLQLGILLLELDRGPALLHPACEESLGIISCFRPKHLPATIQSSLSMEPFTFTLQLPTL